MPTSVHGPSSGGQCVHPSQGPREAPPLRGCEFSIMGREGTLTCVPSSMPGGSAPTSRLSLLLCLLLLLFSFYSFLSTFMFIFNFLFFLIPAFPAGKLLYSLSLTLSFSLLLPSSLCISLFPIFLFYYFSFSSVFFLPLFLPFLPFSYVLFPSLP